MLWTKNDLFWIRIRLIKFLIRIRLIKFRIRIRPSYLLIQEEKDKILSLIGALIFNLPAQDFVPEEISVVDPKLLLLDPDPANNFGSDWIRIHNTGRNPVKLTITSSTGS